MTHHLQELNDNYSGLLSSQKNDINQEVNHEMFISIINQMIDDINLDIKWYNIYHRLLIDINND